MKTEKHKEGVKMISILSLEHNYEKYCNELIANSRLKNRIKNLLNVEGNFYFEYNKIRFSVYGKIKDIEGLGKAIEIYLQKTLNKNIKIKLELEREIPVIWNGNDLTDEDILFYSIDTLKEYYDYWKVENILIKNNYFRAENSVEKVWNIIRNNLPIKLPSFDKVKKYYSFYIPKYFDTSIIGFYNLVEARREELDKLNSKIHPSYACSCQQKEILQKLEEEVKTARWKLGYRIWGEELKNADEWVDVLNGFKYVVIAEYAKELQEAKCEGIEFSCYVGGSSFSASEQIYKERLSKMSADGMFDDISYYFED